MSTTRNPFILGKPIKDPADFYGREHELRELFESVRNMQPVALVGEHRCGNTSILHMMQNPEMQAQYLGSTEGLLFAFANAQLAADGPEAFYRRIARAFKRADPEAGIDVEDEVDQFWIEDYLEELADRGRRLVLLMDELEVLSDFATTFWEWFRGLITEYDMSIVVATRVELGEFRDEWGTGSPFFNMFRTIYIGPLAPSEVDLFLLGVGEATGLDFAPVRPAIDALSGGFPYYLQVVCERFYQLAQSEPLTGSPEQVAQVARELSSRTGSHFEDIWNKLPANEREALAWIALGTEPDGSEAVAFNQTLPRLERRGYLREGRIFSSAFGEFLREHLPRIELSVDTGEVRIEKRLIDLPPKEFALLRFFLEKAGEVVSKDDIATAVWPEYGMDTMGVTDAMIQKTISRLRKEVDLPESVFQHIESIRGQGYRFQNASVGEVLRQDAANGSV
jgi:DNA-binding winged helix-turn-helix (wHTH) protein